MQSILIRKRLTILILKFENKDNMSINLVNSNEATEEALSNSKTMISYSRQINGNSFLE